MSTSYSMAHSQVSAHRIENWILCQCIMHLTAVLDRSCPHPHPKPHFIPRFFAVGSEAMFSMG